MWDVITCPCRDTCFCHNNPARHNARAGMADLFIATKTVKHGSTDYLQIRIPILEYFQKGSTLIR